MRPVGLQRDPPDDVRGASTDSRGNLGHRRHGRPLGRGRAVYRSGSQRRAFDSSGEYYTLEDLRFPTQPPMTTYAVRVAASLESQDGQRLGYPWLGLIENWHERAFTSFGDGHGVWEQSGGNQLPFFVRNFQDIRQWVTGITPEKLMPTILQLTPRFRETPPGEGRARTLSLVPDRIQSVGMDFAPALNGRSTGLVWAAHRKRHTDSTVAPRRFSRRRPSSGDDRPGHEPRRHGQGQSASTR